MYKKNKISFRFIICATTLLLAISFVAHTTASTLPVIYYNFEEQSGSTVINHGTLGGSATIMNTPGWVTGTPGHQGGGYRFNGLEGTANANSINTGLTPSQMGIYDESAPASFTICCWVKSYKPNDVKEQIFFGQDTTEPLHIGLRADGKPMIGFWADDLRATTVVAPNTWNHYVFQFTHDAVQHIYLNGTPISSRQANGYGIKKDNTIILGSRLNTYSYSLDGEIDDVAIYTELLCIEQIKFLANGGDPLNLPDKSETDLAYFTARTGTNDTWNLYRVIGHRSGPYLGWWDAHNYAANQIFNGVAGHLTTIDNFTENEFCRYLSNLGGSQCLIGLTDNETFPGAYESGTATTVPDIEVRRTNGWVWVTGEVLDANSYRNWNTGEPNNSGNGEDAGVIQSSGLWNDIGSGIPDSGDSINSRPAIIKWPLNSPVPIDGAKIIPPIFPDPAELPGADLKVDDSFVGVWVRNAGNIDSLRTASKILTSGEGTVIITNKGIPVINYYDPDNSATQMHRILFRNNQPFFAEIPGVIDNNTVAYYRSKIVIPPGEGGLYTFGVHSDDGFALRILNQNWLSVHGKGYFDYSSAMNDTIMHEYGASDTDTRGIINLASGIHDIELITYNATGGSYHELYAAKGAFTNDADTTTWRLVGHKNIGEINYIGLTENWKVWHALSGAPLSDAYAAMTNIISQNLNLTLWNELNFYDPEAAGSGHEIALPGGAPYPWNTTGDDNNKLLFALGTLNIPEYTTVGIGFRSDDGTRLTVSNQTWNSFVIADNSTLALIDNDSIELDSSGAMTVGNINLTAGQYPISVLHREQSGYSYLDVFQVNMKVFNAQLPFSVAIRTIAADSAATIQDVDGLQLLKRNSMLLIIR